MNLIPLTGDEVKTEGRWQSPDESGTMIWRFQRPTKVYGFEIHGGIAFANGNLYSVSIGSHEQMTGELPMLCFVAHNGVMLELESIMIGVPLTVRTRGFSGRFRPVGEQIL